MQSATEPPERGRSRESSPALAALFPDAQFTDRLPSSTPHNLRDLAGPSLDNSEATEPRGTAHNSDASVDDATRQQCNPTAIASAVPGERKRLPRACDRCRRLKVKCFAEEAPCDRCKSDGSLCVSTPRPGQAQRNGCVQCKRRHLKVTPHPQNLLREYVTLTCCASVT